MKHQDTQSSLQVKSKTDSRERQYRGHMAELSPACNSIARNSMSCHAGKRRDMASSEVAIDQLVAHDSFKAALCRHDGCQRIGICYA